MSLVGSVPGQKKKKKSDLTIGKLLKKVFKGDKGSKMSLLGELPGQEKNTPYTQTAKKFNNKNVKKKYTPAQIAAKKRIGGGTAKNPDKTIAQINTDNKLKIKNTETPKTETKDDKETNKGGDEKPAEEKKVIEKKEGGEQPVVENKNKETLKVKKYIKKKKGKGFVSTRTARGKQLLKIEERKRKLREKRFGKK